MKKITGIKNVSKRRENKGPLSLMKEMQHNSN
jgi:hypothetical protein